MSRKKLKIRQRTFLSTRLKIVVATTVSFVLVFMLVLYFNFFDIKDSQAFSSGDYRTIASGNYDDAMIWEVYDGENWIPAIEPPGFEVRKILVTNGQTMVITDEIPFNQLMIDEGSQVTVESNTIKISKFKNEGRLICNGTLELGTSILEGNGDILIGSTAILKIGSDAGIDKRAMSGNIQMTGKKEFHKEATYVFNGTVAQHTGNGLPSVMKNIVIENASGVTLDQHLQVLNKLELVKGVLNTGKHSLTLGYSISNPCMVVAKSGALSGNIKIWFNAQTIQQLSFPFSDGEITQLIEFTTGEMALQKGMIEVIFKEGIPDDSQKSPFEARQVVVAITGNGYFSAMLSNGPEEARFELKSIRDDKNPYPKITWDFNKNTTNSTATLNTGKSGTPPKIKAISNILYGPLLFKQELVVRFHSDLKTTALIQMTGPKGRLIQMENMKVEEGYNQFVFNPENKITAGDYMVRISNPTEIHTFKVMCNEKSESSTGS